MVTSAKERALVVGTRHAPPFSMKDADGEWVGISIELWRAIAADLKTGFEFRELELEELLEGLENRSLDVAVAALTVTEEREVRFDFSHAFYRSGLAIATTPQPEVSLLAVLHGFASTALLQALALMLTGIWMAGALVWVFERRRNPEQFGGGTLRGLGEAFWWSAVTMTTVGYGDVAPQTLVGKTLAAMVMILGYSIIAVPTGIVTAEIVESAAASRKITTRSCPGCLSEGHDRDAIYCNQCAAPQEVPLTKA